jgi:hypothetical protein
VKEILDNAITNMNNSQLPDNGAADAKDLTGSNIRNIVNNVCNNDDIRYLEIGLYRGGIFSSALYNNSIKAYGIDNWSQNWSGQNSRNAFMDRIEASRENNDITIIEDNCWKPNLIDSKEKFNVYTFDGPHGYQDQYDALIKYIDYMDDEFIYIVDDYDKSKSPDVVKAVEDSIINLNLEKLSEYYFAASAGFHAGILLSCLRKQ